MKLKWLEIERFRTVKPGTRLVFDDGINVVLGKNGTGKTTLLNLISALVTGDFRPYERESFEVRFAVETDDCGLTVQLKTTTSNSESRAPESGISPHFPSEWQLYAKLSVHESVELQITSDGNSAHVEFGSRKETTRPRNVFYRGLYAALFSMVRDSPIMEGQLEPDLLFGLLSGRDCHRFDEALLLFGQFFDPELHDRERPWAAATEAKSGELFLLPSAAIPSFSNVKWTSDAIEINRDTTVWLNEAIRLLEVSDIIMHIRRTSAEPRPQGGRFIQYDRIEFDITFPDGRLINHHMLSYGQKRLLTFLFYLYSVQGPIIADELVNGMHHAWVEACVELLHERKAQAFLSSQNPLLLDELEFADAAAAQRTFIVAELEAGQFRWRQFSDDEARRFFAAYETGIQHVGEVLLTAGLW